MKGECVRCGASHAGPAGIDERHTWRLARRHKRDGSFVLDWYCPACWEVRAKAALPGRPSVGSRRNSIRVSAPRPSSAKPTS
jgi:hypothetical protein